MAIVSTNLKKQLILDVPFAYVMWKQAQPSSRVDKQSLGHFRKKLDNLLTLADLVWGEHRDYQDDITLADQGNVFVNVYFSQHYRSPEHLQAVFRSLKKDAQFAELIDALVYRSEADLMWAIPHLRQVESQSNAEWIIAQALHGQRIRVDQQYLSALLASDDKALWVSAFQLMGDLKIASPKPLTEWREDDDEAVRFYALRADILLGNLPRISELGAFLHADSGKLVEALPLALAPQPMDQALRIVEAIKQMDVSGRIKLWAMAYSGCVQTIPAIIEYAKDEKLSRIAGEAFACITGVDIEEDDLSPIDPDDDPSSLSADKDPWQQDYEIDLAKPGVAELTQWWNTHQSQFNPKQLYLMGRPFDAESVAHIIEHGNQQQRQYAALIKALQNKHSPLERIDF